MLSKPEIVELGAQRYAYEGGCYTRNELVDRLLEELRSQQDLKVDIEKLKVQLRDLNSEVKVSEINSRKLGLLIRSIDDGMEPPASLSDTKE